MGAQVCATTHYAELKVYAMTHPRGGERLLRVQRGHSAPPPIAWCWASRASPTPLPSPAVWGCREYIIDKAAARLDAENVRFEDVLTRLDQQRQEMEKERAEARRLKLEMEQSAAKAREYRKKLEEERSKVVEKAQAEARGIIEEARAASDLALSQLKEMQKRQDRLDWQQVNDSRAEARRMLNEAERNAGAAPHPQTEDPAAHPSRRGGATRWSWCPDGRHQGHGHCR